MNINSKKLLEDQKLSKLCSDTSLKTVEKGKFINTLEEEEGPNEMKNLCREKRNLEVKKHVEWIIGDTKIGPVLDVKVCYHQGRYGVEIMIESFFRWYLAMAN